MVSDSGIVTVAIQSLEMLNHLGKMSNATSDFFQELYSFKPEVVACSAISMIVSAALVPPVIGIVWYEKYVSRNQTILSRLNSLFLKLCLVCYPVMYMDTSRFIHGLTYPSAMCYASIAIKSAVFLSTLIILSIESIFHYRFITFKSQFPIIQDDLLTSICLRITLAISSALVFSRLYLPGRMPTNYYLCTGLDPNGGKGQGAYQREPKKTMTDIYLLYFVCLVYFAHSLMIVYQQVKVDIEMQRQRPLIGSDISSGRLYSRSLKDVFTLMMKMCLWIYSMILIGKVNTADPEELQTYPGLFNVIMLHAVIAPVMVGSVTVMQYVKCEGLRSFANRTMVTFLQDVRINLARFKLFSNNH